MRTDSFQFTGDPDEDRFTETDWATEQWLEHVEHAQREAADRIDAFACRACECGGAENCPLCNPSSEIPEAA